MKINIQHRCSDFSSYRAERVKSLFNVESGANFLLDAELPIEDEGWQIGVVVGPSGSGKSSIGAALGAPYTPTWPADQPIIDAIAAALQRRRVDKRSAIHRFIPCAAGALKFPCQRPAAFGWFGGWRPDGLIHPTPESPRFLPSPLCSGSGREDPSSRTTA